VPEETLQTLTFLTVIVAFISIPALIMISQRKVQLLPEVRAQLEGLNYIVISERPLNISEVFENMTLTPAILINGQTIHSVKNKFIFHRVFRVKTVSNSEFDLLTTIYQKRENEFRIEIKSKKRIY
ncbi:MAG: hypothetical protein AAFN93_11570, partial [Bacteroidota bacterium]